MATPKKKPEDKLTGGQPTKYKPEYCKALIEHCRDGNSMATFGATIGIGRTTVYGWLELFPEFSDAKKEADDLAELYWSNIGKMQATGQLRRLKSEEPIFRDGELVLGKDGKPLMKRTYEGTTGSSSTWIFTMKNRFGWRDQSNVALQNPDGSPLNFSKATDEELRKELAELKALSEKYLSK